MRHYMKQLLGMALFAAALILSPGSKAQAQDVTVSYQSFYDNLSPYGQWVSDPQYGNVWVPNEGGDFRPYGTRGHWVMTDYGNTWVSDDSWGWACYHYGRWTYNSYYGWVWIPGYEWAPAWVNWRYGGGQCGWAPMGPGAEIGVGYSCPDSWWVFVGPQYMYRDNCIHYWGGPSYNNTYIHQTTIINNYYRDNGTQVRYNYGPRAEQIQAVTHQAVQVYHVSQTNRPGAPSVGRNSVSIYRPAVNRATVSSARPANVIQAPKPIGRPQAATNVSAARQPAFRQQIQNNPAGGNRQAAPQNGQRTGAPVNAAPSNRGGNNQPVNRQTPQQQQRNQPQAQPQRQQVQQQQQRQQQVQQQQRQQQQVQQQQRQQQQQQVQQRQQQQQQVQQRQQQQQQVQQRQQQQQRQQAPQPQRSQPMPQQHMEAPREAPHEEGGRR